jgi:hypothetical protein
MGSLEKSFEADVEALLDECRQRGYIPTYFMLMLQQYGGVETAHRLLAGQEIQYGLMRLWELRLLRDSEDAFVIQPKYQSLFTKAEIAEARRRLEELGYKG